MDSAAPGEQRSGRSAPRWHIDPDALAVLEAVFKLEQFPNVETRKQLGDCTRGAAGPKPVTLG